MLKEEGEVEDGEVPASRVVKEHRKERKEKERGHKRARSGSPRRRRRSRSRSRSRSTSAERAARRREREEDERRHAAAEAARSAEAQIRAARQRERDDEARREREARERERERERARREERDRRGGGRRDARDEFPPPPPPPPEPEPELDEAEQARLLAAFEAAQAGGEDAEAAAREAARKRRAALVARHAAAAPPPAPSPPREEEDARAQSGGAGEAGEERAGGGGDASPPPPPPAGDEADMFGDGDAFEAALVGGGGGGAGDDERRGEDVDDVDGYYNARIGEMLDGRYSVFAQLGRGVFSSVLRARDTHAGEGDEHASVAIKIIRANDTMRKAAALEVVILRKLAGADPEGRRHCVRLLRVFEHRAHTALVFESMALNLREVLKKYGRNRGLSLAAVHVYGQQLLVALKHLRNCGVLHADIKPDNILVSERRNAIKLADFGSAMFDGDNEITPLLVSRFYRAPEIMLGLPYGHPLDMWAVGCVLFELFTGDIAFPGRHADGAHAANNGMLRLIIEVKGAFPRKMLKKAAFAEEHFDASLTFAVHETDPVTGRDARRLIRDTAPTRDLATVLANSSRDGGEGEGGRLSLLADLLHKMWTLDPAQRITVAQALSHPFINFKA